MPGDAGNGTFFRNLDRSDIDIKFSNVFFYPQNESIFILFLVRIHSKIDVVTWFPVGISILQKVRSLILALHHGDRWSSLIR